jgi:hypothetical protein
MPKTGNEQKSVKPKVRKLFDKYGWFWWANEANGFGRSGKSDTCAFKNGVLIAAESKFGTNGATALQIGFLNSICMESGFGVVVNEKNIGALEIFLKSFDHSASLVARGEKVGADVGGPMLDALKLLQDYPRDMHEFVAQKRKRTERAKKALAGENSDEADEVDDAPGDGSSDNWGHDDHED